MDKNKVTFEEIFRQNERRIHYHIHKLNISDPHREFYQEGLVAMWNAYRAYRPDKGPLATYFNYTIRNRLIDLMRKQNREKEKENMYLYEAESQMEGGNRYRLGDTTYPLIKVADPPLEDSYYWKSIKSHLTEKQWKWVQFYIIEDMPVKEIAKQEGVTVEAVKSWGKEARRKLRAQLKEM
ncbi:MAG TPA: sigma-70 family RNA polymerase sigma factor [Bacillota bacterium]|nr:sigma-70 family RNA polymerase sigma factor [Bacillota bacterium]